MVKNKGRTYWQAGFTLVELLVVIAIMSILTVISASQFTTAKKKARDVQRKADLSSLSQALGMYFADYGKVPLATMDAGVSGASWGGTFEDDSVNPPYVYMKVMPKENTQSDFPYCYKSDGKKYALFAMLENTDDSECKNNKRLPGDLTNTYSCNNKLYCYSIVSTNNSLNPDGSFK